MYQSYEFIFADIPSSMYGLMVYDIDGKSQSDVPFGNVAKILETRLQGRVRPLHHGVDYNEKPLSFPLVFGSDHELDRWQMQEIAHWLTGHQQYQWLSIEQPDLQHVQFRCLITQLTPISVGWMPVAFEAEVTCDCPYAYGYEFNQTYSFSDGEIIHIFNEGTAREYCKPKMLIAPTSGCSEITISNASDNGRTFSITSLPATSVVYVDNDNCIMEEQISGYDLYDGFNDTFFRLVPGDNVLTMGGSGKITFTGRYYYNTGA